jgi:N-acyl-D-amino-acid deacylase
MHGRGTPRRRADVASACDRVAEVGGRCARDQCRGPDRSTGFIDVHTHHDRALFATPAMAPKVSQGVTAVVTKTYLVYPRSD